MNISSGNWWSGMVRLLAASAALALCQCGVHAGGNDGRIWLKATINGKPARLVFDTGAPVPALVGWAVKKFGLSVTNLPDDESPLPGKIRMITGEGKLKIGHASGRTSFAVLDAPQTVESEMDGVVCWPMARDNIIDVDATNGTVSFLSRLPRKAVGWTKLNLVTDSDILMMTVPQPGGTPCSVLVDTGSPLGVALFPDQWQKWRTAHADQPVTLTAYWDAMNGDVVTEEGWAKTLAIGSLYLTDVPVTKADKLDLLVGSTNAVAVLGMEALKRLDLVIDGKKGFAYLHPKEGPPPPYEYNRLGAVFAPTNMEGGSLVAIVVADSPAWDAGIRPGDVLTHLYKRDVRNWLQDPNILRGLGWALTQPPGTKLDLTVMRGEEEIIVHPVLREILFPEAK